MFKGFTLIFVLTSSLVASEKHVVCYYGTWATYRPGEGKFDVAHINPDLCTHLVYTFVGINGQGEMVSLDSYLDLTENYGKGNFKEINKLKQRNPRLKTILAVGGWNEGSAKYSVMAASQRRTFIDSAIKMILDHGFDGLDIDWEYPNRRDTVHGAADIENFVSLLKELRPELDNHGLLLTAAVSAVKNMAAQSYNIPEISKYVDLINLMTYDMHGPWDPVTGHNAPLHRGSGDDGQDPNDLFTVDMALQYWIDQGAPPDKLMMGVPFYGKTFKLRDPNNAGVGAPAAGVGLAGPYTATNGSVGYNEFCYMLKTESWNKQYDDLAKVPYAYSGSNWVSYDDVKSIVEKVDYALKFNIGGFMIWSIETDDFHGLCGDGDYPLLRAVNRAIGNSVPGPVPSSTTVGSTSSTASVPSPNSVSTSTTESTGNHFTCTEPGVVANPYDCKSFFNCNDSLQPTKMPCPEPLLFDQHDKVCNYPDLVSCREL